MPPSSAALKSLSDPSSRPIGVLAPPAITTSPIPATIQRCSTRIDHVGIACRDLAAKIEFYTSTFGLTVVSEETNAEQGVREAMLAVGETAAGTSYVQLLEPLHPRHAGRPVPRAAR